MRRRARGSVIAPSSGPQRRNPGADKSVRRTPAGAHAGLIPPEWLSELLKIACGLPIEKGPDEVATAIIDRASALLPSCALGVTLGEDLAAGTPARFVRGAQGGATVSLVPSADRLFPHFQHERAVTVQHPHESVRLHIASDDPAKLHEGGPVHLFIARVGDVLGSALGAARLISIKGREPVELTERIIQSAKLASLGQMAAGVVHELTNPLTSIVGYSDYLRAKAEREHADPRDIEKLHRIGESAGRILRFSRDLIAYARPSTQPPAAIPIAQIIEQALVFCEHVLGRTGIRVERKFASGLLPVLGVRDQLTQVFVNLFTNACHAMEPGGGTLTVETETDGLRRVVRSVIGDTGHGIDKENLDRIFEPFFTTKTDGRGTGLGLSIVRNIVLLHGGVVSVDSELDRGTTFVIELPSAR